MHDIFRRRKNQKRLYGRSVLILVVILTIIFLRSAWGVYRKKLDSEKALIQAQQEAQELEERQALLAAKIEHLKTPEGVEAEILEKFNVAREGEKVAFIVDGEPKSDIELSAEGGFWSGLWSKVRAIFN